MPAFGFNAPRVLTPPHIIIGSLPWLRAHPPGGAVSPPVMFPGGNPGGPIMMGPVNFGGGGVTMAPGAFTGAGFGGFGQANCPSMEQLMGITDVNDPCQLPAAGLPLPTSTAAMVGPVTAGASPFSSTSPTGLVGSSLPSWLLPVGIGVVVLFFLAGAMKR